MSATMMMNPAQQQPLPHRKPVPGRPSYGNFQQQQQQQQYIPDAGSRAGSMARAPGGSPSQMTMPPQQHPQYNQQARRTPSNATSSTTSSIANNTGLQRIPTNSSVNAPRRSTSSRSNSSGSPTSYVALMRKQKATVWCDRAQAEDPRILAAQRAAKTRAAMEVAGGSHRISTSSNAAPTSSGIRSKIRHHGAPKASTYTGQANLAGAGVPMRLSASEVDEDDSDEEDSKYVSHYHMRNGSRNSSMGNNQQRGGMYTGSGTNSTPGSGRSPEGTMGNLADEETPVPNAQNLKASDYMSAGGGDGEEAEASYGSLSGLPQRTGEPEKERKTAEELRRRGSVDDRSMTMTGTRLFIANPDRDLSD